MPSEWARKELDLKNKTCVFYCYWGQEGKGGADHDHAPVLFLRRNPSPAELSHGALWLLGGYGFCTSKNHCADQDLVTATSDITPITSMNMPMEFDLLSRLDMKTKAGAGRV